MKCQKCGKNEVNFHYSSNVNGNVTQVHMCSECASESGYDIGQMFGDMLPVLAMFPMQKRMESLMTPSLQMTDMFPMFGLETRIPTGSRAHAGSSGIQPATKPCSCGCKAVTHDVSKIEVDEKLNQKRELNKQMRIASQNEEFEKAAEFRDKIKELDAQ